MVGLSPTRSHAGLEQTSTQENPNGRSWQTLKGARCARYSTLCNRAHTPLLRRAGPLSFLLILFKLNQSKKWCLRQGSNLGSLGSKSSAPTTTISLDMCQQCHVWFILCHGRGIPHFWEPFFWSSFFSFSHSVFLFQMRELSFSNSMNYFQIDELFLKINELLQIFEHLHN